MELRYHLKKEEVEEDLSKLILLVSKVAVNISESFHEHQDVLTSKNIHGEHQMALDKYADCTMLEALEYSRLVKNVASEEQDDVVEIKKAEGSYGVVMDPLDGSSLIKVNLAVGTIVGFFDEGDVMEPGNKMDAAMFVLYGPVTTLVYCAGKGVHEFVLHKDEWLLRAENLMIPEGRIYAPGGRRNDYTPAHKAFIEELESQGYKVRFSGGFVPDFNLVLHQGGVFTYPAMNSKPDGKLRLLFEGNPMAFLAKHAGGYASDGNRAILDKKPTSITNRTPVYIGSKSTVERAEKLHKESTTT